MEFWKYQALGNDYLVVDASAAARLDAALVRRLCDRHFGLGADGVLARTPGDPLGLRIWNPDGSEAEKSGNGLRIFARWAVARGLAGPAPFAVRTAGGVVHCEVRDGGRTVAVDMGPVRFDSAAIPVTGPPREVLDEPLAVAGQTLRISAASVGNPHCVVLRERVTRADVERLGPLLERHPAFPARTNVQLVEVLDARALRIEIWERGAGYTLASGSSSCAAAAVAHRLGRVGPAVTVHMPGGALEVTLDAAFRARQLGPVRAIARGVVADELLAPDPDATA